MPIHAHPRHGCPQIDDLSAKLQAAKSERDALNSEVGPRCLAPRGGCGAGCEGGSDAPARSAHQSRARPGSATQLRLHPRWGCCLRDTLTSLLTSTPASARPETPCPPQHRRWTALKTRHDAREHPPGPFPLGRLLEAASRVPDTVLTRLGEPYMIWWVP